MDINIFLASSSELKEDRDSFQVLISQLNEEWCYRDLCFKLKIWENFIDSMSQDGLQEEYNKAVAESDIFVMLFFTKVGKYTSEEFETAFRQFQLNKKPRIYTYFKEAYIFTGEINDEIISMLQFKKKLAALDHYPTVYTSIEDLKWKFCRQLEKIYGNKLSPVYDLKNIKSKSQIDSLAIESVCKLLSPQSDDTTLQNLRLHELISRASEFGKNAVFQLAKVNRRANRTSDRDLMARSIPVFEALVEANARKDRHYYFGQLAYALKDQAAPDWKKAEENFNVAIDIRGPGQPEYFYEFNRAICKVCNSAGTGPGAAADNGTREFILQDLCYAKKGIGYQFEKLILEDLDNRPLWKWLKINGINPADI
jgi:hypothetical protein